jgi:hypothetical protein
MNHFRSNVSTLFKRIKGGRDETEECVLNSDDRKPRFLSIQCSHAKSAVKRCVLKHWLKRVECRKTAKSFVRLSLLGKNAAFNAYSSPFGT